MLCRPCTVLNTSLRGSILKKPNNRSETALNNVYMLCRRNAGFGSCYCSRMERWPRIHTRSVTQATEAPVSVLIDKWQHTWTTDTHPRYKYSQLGWPGYSYTSEHFLSQVAPDVYYDLEYIYSNTPCPSNEELLSHVSPVSSLPRLTPYFSTFPPFSSFPSLFSRQQPLTWHPGTLQFDDKVLKST